MRIDGQTRHSRRITLVCLLLILITTFAQAGHNCSALVLDSANAPHLTATITSNSPCLLCMLAHTATLVFVVLLLSIVPAKQPRTLVVDLVPVSSWTGFSLSVRPPPSLV